MPSTVHIFQKIEAIRDICNIFIVNKYNFILVKNKNMLRTFWASKGLLNKNLKSNLDVLLKKKVFCSLNNFKNKHADNTFLMMFVGR